MAFVFTGEKKRLLDTQGHILARGGAGSGKTTVALAKACVELEAGRLGPVGKALFLSFARATIARVAEQATAHIPRGQLARIEINTYHGFAWTILKSHAYLLCDRPGVSLLLPAQARDRLAGLDGTTRLVRQRELFDREGLVAFDLFPTLLVELFDKLPILATAYAQAYPLIIVDEFQDTNAEEWAMISRLGQRSTLIALGDPKQRIYDFKGADPRRFDDLITAFQPAEFDFKSENNRSPGTEIPAFADAVLLGRYDKPAYAGVTITAYPGQNLRPLKAEVLQAAGRLRKRADWSLAVLVPSNALAASVYDYLRRSDHGLPAYPADILVSAEGPMLASAIVALLLEPRDHSEPLGALFLEALAAFEIGRQERATAGAITKSRRCRDLARNVRGRGDLGYGVRGVGSAVGELLTEIAQIAFSGDPIRDWLQVRNALIQSPREEFQAIGRDSRYLRLLQRGAQIESRFAEAWRAHGAYREARRLLADAIIEDQFAATARAPRGVTVMTIHKAKGKEFDEVIVFEGPFNRFLPQGSRGDRERSARLNLHVAATRARTAVRFMTPKRDPCPLLP